jgi:hypothetical protein
LTAIKPWLRRSITLAAVDYDDSKQSGFALSLSAASMWGRVAGDGCLRPKQRGDGTWHW